MHFCPKNDILKSEKSPRKEAAMPTLTDPAVIKEQKRIAALFRKNLGQRAPANEGAEAAPPERS